MRGEPELGQKYAEISKRNIPPPDLRIDRAKIRIRRREYLVPWLETTGEREALRFFSPGQNQSYPANHGKSARKWGNRNRFVFGLGRLNRAPVHNPFMRRIREALVGDRNDAEQDEHNSKKSGGSHHFLL